MFVKINGETHFLWRAVDHEGEVLEIYVTKHRDKGAAFKIHEEVDETAWPTGSCRHGQTTFVWRGDEGHWKCRQTGNRALEK